LLGTKHDDIFSKLKPSTSLLLNSGGCKFTIDEVTNLTPLFLFIRTVNSLIAHPTQMPLGRLNSMNILTITEGDEEAKEEDDDIAGKLNIHDLLNGTRHLSLSCSTRNV
jgi:hypothetical protein